MGGMGIVVGWWSDSVGMEGQWWRGGCCSNANQTGQCGMKCSFETSGTLQAEG